MAIPPRPTAWAFRPAILPRKKIYPTGDDTTAKRLIQISTFPPSEAAQRAITRLLEQAPAAHHSRLLMGCCVYEIIGLLYHERNHSNPTALTVTFR
jgi:hypothetical protein